MSAGNLNAQDVLAYLARFGTAAKTEDDDVQEERQGYREAAAVKVAVNDLEELQPIRVGWRPGQAAQLLAAECVPATGHRLGGHYMLAPEIRTATIKQLASDGRLTQVLDANRTTLETPLQRQYERYLRQDARPLDEQSLDELELTHQISVWLGGVLPGVPAPEEVAVRVEELRLLAPFEALAGDKVFRGRRTELDRLRNYIGVVPPESLRSRIGGHFRWAFPERQPAICIFGPGGVGKSALVARFMLEHTRLPEDVRIPFGYLDFDRVALDVGDPLGLTLELLRQLDLQFPEQNQFADLRQDAVRRSGGSEIRTSENGYRMATALLGDVLQRMRGTLGPRPYVIVLDTFEQVQYRGESRAAPLWSMLNGLQQIAPFLRVIVAGRAPVESLLLSDRPPRRLPLAELDREAAVALLAAQGITDGPLVKQLIDTFGQMPLSLTLLGNLAARLPGGAASLLSERATARSLLRATDEYVQGYLYERILDRIDNEQVRRLAHPGLILRRINPSLILNVLNEPCELNIGSLDEAWALYEELERETALVTVDSADGDLVHRSDLRRVMLKLLTADAPALVAQIRHAAIAWYRANSGRRANAEEIYHRLHLGEEVSSRELTDSEVRASIQIAIEEFPLTVQLRLATMGFEVPDEVRQHATQEDREARLSSEVEERLAYWPDSEPEIRSLLSGVKSPAAGSPLFRTMARVAAQDGDEKQALELIERGLRGPASTWGAAERLLLLQDRAWLSRMWPDDVAEWLSALQQSARSNQSPGALLQHRLQRLALHKAPSGKELQGLSVVLGEADAFDLWGLVPALEPVVYWAEQLEVAGMLLSLSHGLHRPQSPFEGTIFPDPYRQDALDAVLRSDAELDPFGFARAFGGLCKAWPYRVLFVSPPYGRRGEVFSLSEA